MVQRPQPSLRLADGGSFITRWAQSVMRPDATANRLRQALELELRCRSDTQVADQEVGVYGQAFRGINAPTSQLSAPPTSAMMGAP